MLFTHDIALGILCTIALAVALGLTRRRVYPFSLPPGPRPLPILGNALQLDTKRPWLTYTAWGKTHGKIIHSRMLGIDLIIINSEIIARELLDKRSANYSSRPVIRTNELIQYCVPSIWRHFTATSQNLPSSPQGRSLSLILRDVLLPCK